jgi:uncharacterized protein involved in outer membrane biogenesis
MNNRRKTVLRAFGALAFIGIASALAFHLLVDSESLKRIARDKVAAATGRELIIGEAALRIFPAPALHVEKVVLGPAPGKRETNALKAESIDARIALLPLLTGTVRVKGLVLDGVQATFDSDTGLSRPGDAGTKAAPGALLDLESVRITDSDLTWRAKDAPAVFWHVDDAASGHGRRRFTGTRRARLGYQHARGGRTHPSRGGPARA